MTAYQPMITGNQHVVAAGHDLATQAAMDILEAGGNALPPASSMSMAAWVAKSWPAATTCWFPVIIGWYAVIAYFSSPLVSLTLPLAGESRVEGLLLVYQPIT